MMPSFMTRRSRMYIFENSLDAPADMNVLEVAVYVPAGGAFPAPGTPFKKTYDIPWVFV